MNRITYVNIAGKEYPLNFSVKAAKAVDEKFGSLHNLSGVFGWEDVSTSLRNVSWVLQLLIEQGAAYLKLTEGKEIEVPEAEEFEILLGGPDLETVMPSILKAIGFGMKQTVETEDDEKNTETTQGK